MAKADIFETFVFSGQYLCHVSNGVGQPLHTIVNVTVKVPPKMVAKDSTKRSDFSKKLSYSLDSDLSPESNFDF